MNPVIKKEIITPEIATNYLSKNKKNRGVRAGNLKKLEEEIRGKRWALNGETIKFSKEGDLLDGQHRLLAVINTGESVESFVAYGIDPSSMETIDTGRSRNAIDILSMNGVRNAANTASALNYMKNISEGAKDTCNKTIPQSDIVAAYLEHSTIDQSINACLRTRKFIPIGLMAAIHYLFSKKDPNLANDLIEGLAVGFPVNYSDPFYLLRLRLEGFLMTPKRKNADTLTELIIRAWNAKRRGDKLKALQVKGEIPKIV